MPKDARTQEARIDRFFSGPGARADSWRDLVEGAKAWSRNLGAREQFEALLAPLAVTEEYHGYPGPHLMAALKERAASGEAAATLSLATRITQALQLRSFRQHAGDWSVHDEGQDTAPDLLPPSFGHTDAHRPYFETLIVTGAPAAS